MKRTLFALFAAAVLAALAVLVGLSRNGVRAVYAASSGCTNATLNSNYGLIWSGFAAANKSVNSPQVPWTGVGVMSLDGAGNVSASTSTAFNGSLFTNQSSAGTYIVNSDCTGSLTFTSGNGAGFTANLVIIGGGTEVFGLDLGTGETMSFDMKKQ